MSLLGKKRTKEGIQNLINFLRKNIFFAVILLAGIFVFSYFVIPVLAAPPTTVYYAGETLNPNCSPGDTNCSVAAPITTTFAATTTVTMGGYAINFYGGDVAIGDYSTTSTISKNSLILAQASGYNLGKFYVDSSGNVSASGTITALTALVTPSITLNGEARTSWPTGGGGATAFSPTSTFISPLTVTNGSTTSSLSSNSLSIATSSANMSGLFNVDSSGNVNASGTLRANAVAAGGAAVGGFGASVYSSLYLGGNTGINWANGNALISESAWDLVFSNYTGSGPMTEKMRIKGTSGNIGIGTAAPTDKLTVVGNILSGNGTVSSTLGANYLAIATSTTDMVGKFYVDSSGNVSASGTLNLTNSAVTSTIAGGLAIETSGFVYDWQTNRVGIGTAAPTSKLTVNGEIRVNRDGATGNSITYYDGSGNQRWYSYLTGASYTDLTFGDSAERVTLKSGGKVGIGTTNPVNKLTVVGDIGAQGNVLSGNGTVSSTLGANYLAIATSTTDMVGKFYVDSSGNVSASGSLRVFANVTSSGHIYPASNNTVDLGAYGSAFRNTYASGSLYIGGNGNITTATNTLNLVGNFSNLLGATSPMAQITTAAVGGAASAPNSVFVSGRYAYTANSGANTISVVDISDPSYPVQKGTAAVGTTPYSIFVAGRYAYVANYGSANMSVVDISNPTTPVQKATVTVGTNPFAIFVSGRYAYVANYGSFNISVVDISDPKRPAQISTLTIGDYVTSIYVSGRYAYVTAADETYSSNYMAVVDISDPAAPTLVTTVAVGSNPRGVYVSGRYAYVANYGGNTVSIIDIANPSTPKVMNTVSIGAGTGPYSVFVSGRHAYTANYTNNTITAVDVVSSTAPVKLASATVGTNPASIFVSGRYAYTANYGGANISVADVSGSEVSSLVAHSADVGNLQSRNDITAHGNIEAGTSLFVGAGGILSNGSVGIFASSTSALYPIFSVASIGTPNIFNILPNGNVAIGTSTASDKLTVAGHITSGDGTTTSTLQENALIVAQASGYNLGKFYVDSSGNTSASGTLNLPNSSVTSTIAGGLTVDTSGFVYDWQTNRVGIGTASPAYKLDVKEAGGSLLSLDASDSGSPSMVWKRGNVAVWENQVVSSDNSYRLYSYTENLGYHFTILPSGNVGIGTTAPTDKLTVVGNILAGNGTVSSTLGANYLAIATSTADMLGKFYVDSSGNVSASGTIASFGAVSAVGSTYNSPAFKLGTNTGIYGSTNLTSVSVGSASLTYTFQQSSFGNDYSDGFIIKNARTNQALPTYSWTSDTDTGIYNPVANAIGFSTNATEKMRIDSAGRVGIGTTAPTDKLTVVGNILAGNGTVSSTLGANYLAIATSTADMLGKFYVDSSGNVSASGTIQLAAGVVGAPAYSFVNDTDTGIYNISDGTIGFAANGSRAFFVDSGGFYSDNKNLGAYGYAFNNVYASGTLYSSSTLVGAGTAGAPTYSFAGDTNTGIYNPQANQLGITVDGALRFNFSGSGLQVYGGIFSDQNNTRDLGYFGNAWGSIYASNTLYASSTLVGLGTAGAPTFSFARDENTGIYSPGADQLNISVGGSIKLQVASGGITVPTNITAANLLPYSHNGYDIGAYATAWKNLYASGTLYVGTGVAGVATVITGGYGTTSTINQDTGFELGGGAVSYGASTTILTVSSLETGALNMPDDAGIIGWTNLDITTTTANLDMSYSASMDDNNLLTIYGQTQGDGGGRNYGVMIGYSTTTAPYEIFDIDHKFAVSSSTGNIMASGSLWVYGNVTSSGHIYPATNNAVNLGGYNMAFANIFASNTLYASSTQVNGGKMGAPGYAFAGDLDTGFYNATANDIYITVAGTAAMEFTSGNIYAYHSILLGSNNIYDLGSPTTNWRNVYVSSTVFSNKLITYYTIGIGNTTSPYAPLSIATSTTGQVDMFVIASSTEDGVVFKVDSYGLVYADGAYTSPASDYAEYFYTNDTDLIPGEVVCFDGSLKNAVKRCVEANSENTMGVISTKPMALGNYQIGRENDPNYKQVGLLGQIPVIVSAANGEVKTGDYLASSDIPGVAMKAAGPGKIIGVAMEGFGARDSTESKADSTDMATGTIMVFVNPQWSVGRLDSEGAFVMNEYPTEFVATNLLDKFTLAVKNSLRKLGLVIQNGVAKVKSLIAEKVQTDLLCVGSTCVTEEQLKSLLNNQGMASSPAVIDSTGEGLHGLNTDSTDTAPVGGTDTTDTMPTPTPELPQVEIPTSTLPTSEDIPAPEMPTNTPAVQNVPSTEITTSTPVIEN